MTDEVIVPDAVRNINQLRQSEWCSMSLSARQQKGFYPNGILWPRNKNDAPAIVTSKQSARGDFALNEHALRRAGELNAEVWLLEADGTVVARETAQNVLAKLANVRPLDGQLGPYWWVDKNFNSLVTTRNGFAVFREDDESAPF